VQETTDRRDPGTGAEVRCHLADVIGRDKGLPQADLVAADDDRLRPGESGRRQPAVHHEVGVGDDHPEGVADRIAHAMLADVEPELAHLLGRSGWGESPITTQPGDDGVRTGERPGPGGYR
jgi:hypothetical protein